jgi:hypothetical protein
MDSQQQTAGPANRPSFSGKIFGQPPFWRVVQQAGPRFWAGTLWGVGLGLMVAAILLDLELLKPHWKVWAILPGVILMVVGQERLRVVVRHEGKENSSPLS